MTLEPALRLIAGTFVIASVLLGMYVDARFLWFTLFVGANLFQSGLTRWCPMMAFLRRLGLREAGATCAPVDTARRQRFAPDQQ